MLRDNGKIWETYGLEEAKNFLQEKDLGKDHPSRIFIRDWIKGTFNGKPSLLDIPCGSGVDYEVLKDVCTYTGMDRTQIILDAAKANYKSIKVKQGEIRQIPLEDNSFDIVQARAIFEHLPSIQDVDLAMKECFRVAKEYCIFSFFLPLKDETRIVWNGEFFNNVYSNREIEWILNSLNATSIKREHVDVSGTNWIDSYDIFIVKK